MKLERCLFNITSMIESMNSEKQNKAIFKCIQPVNVVKLNHYVSEMNFRGKHACAAPFRDLWSHRVA